jgi:hypothetical protein
MSNFIEQYPDSITSEECLSLITLFESSPELQKPGHTTLGYNPENKKDTEILLNGELINNNQDWKKAFTPVYDALYKNLDLYKEKYTHLEDLDVWAIQKPGINFQRFYPNEGYKTWHCEVPCAESSKRVLVWMLYLNTVTDLGGTEFDYQNFTCKAESGKMVIWPPYWTHFHRSQVSPSQVKYIMTGWFAYV